MEHDMVSKVVCMESNTIRIAVDEPQNLRKPVEEVICIGKTNTSQDGIVVSPKGISPCKTSGHGNTPKIIERIVPLKQVRERMDHSGTIQLVKIDLQGKRHLQTYRIRKLTPRECFRLMGVNEADISSIQDAGICKTQQYKLAGNSIVVDVMQSIFSSLFRENLFKDEATTHRGVKKHDTVTADVTPLIIQRPRGFLPLRVVDKYCPSITKSQWESNNVLAIPTKPRSVIWRGVEIHEGDGFYLYNSHQLGGLKGISRTLKHSKDDAAVVQHGRIRKFTPRESFRLMGMNEDEISRLQSSGVTNSMQKKLAGNSIVVDVMVYIFKNLLIERVGR